MHEESSAQKPGTELPVSTEGPPAGHLRQVRVAYGRQTVTISVVETVHRSKSWRSQSKLVSIKQFPLEEFIADGRSILDAYVADLLLPPWPITEGASLDRGGQ